MIDHVLGKPSPLWKRAQVFLVIFFWGWRLYIGDGKRSRRRDAHGKGYIGKGYLGSWHGSISD